MRGSIERRCAVCRASGLANLKCGHKEANFHIRYRYKGKQYSKCAGSNKKDAQRMLADVISRIHNGSYQEQEEIGFSDFSERWLRDFAEPRIKDSTLRNYRSVIKNRFIPFFRNEAVSSITPQKIQSLMAASRKGEFSKKALNSHTINKSLVLLKTMFKHAKRWNYVRENPAEDLERFKTTLREMDFLRPDEVRTLLAHAIEPSKTLLLTAILTGLRRGELLGLQWGDIDWANGLINVRRSVFSLCRNELSDPNAKGWKFVTPKSSKSIRRVVMTPQLKEALEIHKLNSPINSYDLIFANRKGEPIDGQNMIHREFYPTLEAAELRQIRFHDLRHSYTSLLIAQNENVKFIQSQLGHASITTTMDRYGHLMPLDTVKVGTKLDEQLFGSKKTDKELQYA